MLITDKVKRSAHVAVWAALLFVLVTYKAGYEVATWLICCGVTGYLNGFVLFPFLVSTVKGRRSSMKRVVLSVFALALSFFVVHFGYGALLALCTMSFLLVYAIVVAFAD